MFSNTDVNLSDFGFDSENVGSYEEIADIIKSIYGFEASADDISDKLKLAESVGLNADQMQALATVWAASYILTAGSADLSDDVEISCIVDGKYADIDAIISKYTNKDIVLGYIAGMYSTMTEGEGAGTVDAAQLKSDESVGQLSAAIRNAVDYSELGVICAAYDGISDIDMINNKLVIDRVASMASATDSNVKRLFDEGELVKVIGSHILGAIEDAKKANVSSASANEYDISLNLISGVMPKVYSERAAAIQPYMDKLIAQARSYASGDEIAISDFEDTSKSKAFGIIADMFEGDTARK
jgi:hypothetical protein